MDLDDVVCMTTAISLGAVDGAAARVPRLVAMFIDAIRARPASPAARRAARR